MFAPPIGSVKLNSNTTFLNGDLDIGAIVCDVHGGVLLAININLL